MSLFDTAYFALLTVVMPVYGYISFRRYVKQASAGSETPRPMLYLETQIIEWVLFGCLAALWLFAERPWSALGFVSPGGTGFWVAVLLAAVVSAYLLYVWQSVRKSDDESKLKQRRELGDLEYFMPRTRNDYRHFFMLSLTAGFVEEVIYRGFLFWFFTHWMPIWGALVASSIVFGLGHSYQGLGGILRVFLVGLLAGGLYWLSGSIWVPIALHAIADILQGAILLEFWQTSDANRRAEDDAHTS